LSSEDSLTHVAVCTAKIGLDPDGIPQECHRKCIQEIAERADHEYNMSALGPHMIDDAQMDNHRERSMRGRNRINRCVEELQSLESNTSCPACKDEITRQIHLQTQAVKEIEKAWGINGNSPTILDL
jgi:hypothetical protein